MSSPSGGDRNGASRNPRVGVEVLQGDQFEVLFDTTTDDDTSLSALKQGFESRRDVMNWWQAANVRTFGHLLKRFPPTKLIGDSYLCQALTASDPTDAELMERQRLLEHIKPTFEMANRALERQAPERLNDDADSQGWTQIDRERQEHIAMRPGLSYLDQEQARVLAELWYGFRDREDVIRWLYSIDNAAEFGPLLDARGFKVDMAGLIAQSDHLRRQLQRDTAAAGRDRERFAAKWLLPAYSIRALRMDAGERVSTERQERETLHG